MEDKSCADCLTKKPEQQAPNKMIESSIKEEKDKTPNNKPRYSYELFKDENEKEDNDIKFFSVPTKKEKKPRIKKNGSNQDILISPQNLFGSPSLRRNFNHNINIENNNINIENNNVNIENNNNNNNINQDFSFLNDLMRDIPNLERSNINLLGTAQDISPDDNVRFFATENPEANSDLLNPNLENLYRQLIDFDEMELAENPKHLKIELYEFQKMGLWWMKKREDGTNLPLEYSDPVFPNSEPENGNKKGKKNPKPKVYKECVIKGIFFFSIKI